jgi:Domain of unknown function DUF29
MALPTKSVPFDKAANSLYERDFYEWLNMQAAALREGNLQALDTENLAEELEGMARSQKAAVRSQLARLVAHLLKWSVQRELRKNQRSANSWRGSIAAARHELSDLLEDSPSLKGHLETTFPRACVLGIKWAMEETRLPEKAFPDTCPWNLTEVLSENFYPDEAANGRRQS